MRGSFPCPVWSLQRNLAFPPLSLQISCKHRLLSVAEICRTLKGVRRGTAAQLTPASPLRLFCQPLGDTGCLLALSLPLKVFVSFLSSPPSQVSCLLLFGLRNSRYYHTEQFPTLFSSSAPWIFHLLQMFFILRPPCPKRDDCAVSPVREKHGLLSEVFQLVVSDSARLESLPSRSSLFLHAVQRQVPCRDCHALIGGTQSLPDGQDGS